MRIIYKILVCAVLLLPSISFADGWNWSRWPWSQGAIVAGAPDLVTSGGATNDGANKSNSDRRRTSGSALILEQEGKINEPTIPSNSINKVEGNVPENKIFEGKVIDQPIPVPETEKHLVVEPK